MTSPPRAGLSLPRWGGTAEHSRERYTARKPPMIFASASARTRRTSRPAFATASICFALGDCGHGNVSKTESSVLSGKRTLNRSQIGKFDIHCHHSRGVFAFAD